MSKEVINHVCRYCESEFKLSYDPNNVSGFPKFCPFCGEESLAEELEDSDINLDGEDD